MHSLNIVCVCVRVKSIKSLIYPSYLVVSLLQHLLWAKRGIWTLSARHLRSDRERWDWRKSEERKKKHRRGERNYRQKIHEKKRVCDVRPSENVGHWWQLRMIYYAHFQVCIYILQLHWSSQQFKKVAVAQELERVIHQLKDWWFDSRFLQFTCPRVPQ